MTDTTLIQRLRTAWTYCGVEQALRFEAADALEQQAAQIAEKDAEIARLTECLSKANANHEHFERAWYLRGYEVEALRADAERYRWLRRTTNAVTSKGDRIDVRNNPELWDSAIDAALRQEQGGTR